MKTLKLVLLNLTLSLLVFTSCTNNEPIVDNQQTTEESESITISLNQLQTQFDQNGNFYTASNPTGNIVFDFCFDFVYPLTLSYNNGTIVTVNDLDELVEVILSSNSQLYISAVAFPFDVETYSESSNTIEVVTITNEEDFENLLENCGFDDDSSCDCFELYDPVCVTITAPTGNVVTITYPNECYAECNGFDDDDFIDDCVDNFYPFNNTCFQFNYPVSIIVDYSTVIEVNNDEEFINTIYGYYEYNLIYPINVTLEDQTVITVNDQFEYEDIIEDCIDDDDYNQCEECEDEPTDPVCVNIEDENGNIITYTFDNACYALCEGYTEADFVFCNSGNDLCLPSAVSDALTNNDGWSINNFDGSVVYSEFEIIFNADGSLEWEAAGNTFTGNWSVEANPVNGNTMILSFAGPNLQAASGDWMIVECDLPCSITLLSDNGNEMTLSRDCE